MSIFIRTLPNVMRHFDCSAESAQRYIDLRDEGYPSFQAAIMAGLSDPPDYQRPSIAKGALRITDDGASCEAAEGTLASSQPDEQDSPRKE
jgi:hypothetical protein